MDYKFEMFAVGEKGIAVTRPSNDSCVDVYVNGKLADWFSLDFVRSKPDRFKPIKLCNIGPVVTQPLPCHYNGFTRIKSYFLK